MKLKELELRVNGEMVFKTVEHIPTGDIDEPWNVSGCFAKPIGNVKTFSIKETVLEKDDEDS